MHMQYLGSVSEETKGTPGGFNESVIQPNNQLP